MKSTILESSLNKINSFIGGGLSRKFSVWVLIIILVLGGLTNIVIQISLSQTLSNELRYNGEIISKNLAFTSIEPILIDDKLNLYRVIQNAKNIQDNIIYVYVVDAEGNELVSTFENGIPNDFLIFNNNINNVQLIKTEFFDIIDFKADILNGDLGYVHVGISESSIHQVIFATRNIILFLTLLIGGIGVLFAYYTGNYLISPIKTLIMGTKEIGRGNLGFQITVSSSDEIHYLAEAFNKMSQNLSMSINDLLQSEERYKKIVDGTSDAVILIDDKKLILSWNSAAQKIFGYKYKEVENKNIQMLYSSLEAPPIGKTGEILSREGIFIKNNGSFFPGLYSQKSLLIGKSSSNVIVIRDISEQKEKEKLEHNLIQTDGLATLGQLAAGVAHEINNPLTNISLYAQLLLEKITDKDIINKLKIISDEADRAANISRGLLEFARQSEPVFSSADINSEISEVLNIINYDLENIILTKNFGSIPNIIVDKVQIKRVFMNIISNSIQSISNEGKISIKTSVDGDYLKIIISDSGCGISKENLKRIFDPFFTTKPLGKGTGLGLSVCYGIIKRHNGYIYVQSKLGEGTAFTIKLPV